MPPTSARASSRAQALTRLNEAIQSYAIRLAKVRLTSGSTHLAGVPTLKEERLTPDLGHDMTSTTSYQQGTRAGAVIVLTSGQGHDPDGTRAAGLTDRSDGYQAPMTQEQDSQGQERQGAAQQGRGCCWSTTP